MNTQLHNKFTVLTSFSKVHQLARFSIRSVSNSVALWTSILLLVGFVASSVPAFAIEHTPEIQISQNIVASTHYFNTLNFKDTIYFPDGFLLESSLGLGNLLDWSEPVLTLETNVYRRIPGLKDYSLGLGYKYLYNRHSFYNELGGKLTERTLSLKVRGETTLARTDIISELSFAPFGAFTYMGEHVRSMYSLNLRLAAVTPITAQWNVILEANLGKQTYVNTTSAAQIFRVGLQYKLR